MIALSSVLARDPAPPQDQQLQLSAALAQLLQNGVLKGSTWGGGPPVGPGELSHKSNEV